MAEATIIPGPGSRGFARARPRARYTAAAQAFHWLTALLILAILPVAWHMQMIPRTQAGHDTWYTVHKSLGLTVLAVTALRLVWRASHPAPELPGSLGRVERGLARASHWALYAVLVVMPVSGYLISTAGGHPVSYFGLFTVPSLVPPNPDLSRAADLVHVAGQWAVYALLALHLAATAWHLVCRRDGLLDRMLPEQDET